VNHPEFGWQAFGGNTKVDGDWIRIQPLDAFRQRVYLAPVGLWLTLDSGTFDSIEFNTRTHSVHVGFSPVSTWSPNARLRIQQPSKISGIGAYHPKEKLSKERDTFMVPLQAKTAWINLVDDRQ
jgi:hypothetical protein